MQKIPSASVLSWSIRPWSIKRGSLPFCMNMTQRISIRIYRGKAGLARHHAQYGNLEQIGRFIDVAINFMVQPVVVTSRRDRLVRPWVVATLVRLEEKHAR